MSTRRIGNRRLFKLSNHRLSKQSFYQNIQLLEQAVINQNILLFGANAGTGQARALGGLISDLFYSVTITGSTVVVNFVNKAFLAYGPNDSAVDDGPRVVVYDPASPVQIQTSIDLSAYVGTDGFIWWRPETADTDLRSEAHWVVPTGEMFSPIETVNAEYVSFFVTPPSPHPTVNYANGWRLLAYIKSWSGFNPTLDMIHYLDSHYALDRKLLASTFTSVDYLNPVFVGHGIVNLIKRIVDQIWMFQDSTANIDLIGQAVTPPSIATSWYKRPKYGAEQVAANIDALHVTSRTGVLATVPVVYDTVTTTWGLVPTPGSVYSVGGFLAAAPAVSTVQGAGAYNTCMITLAMHGGYVISGVAAVINRHVPVGLPLSNFPPPITPIGYAASHNSMPLNITSLSAHNFYVGCRVIMFGGSPGIYNYYTTAPETLSFVVYGYKTT